MTQVRFPFLAAATCWAAVLPSGCGLADGPPYEIRGTARLPDCTQTPVADLSGTWFDNGEVTITSEGCDEVAVGERRRVCALSWDLEQQGGDVRILVDDEYRMRGRLCDDQLHLEGGWWLPTENETLGCTYDEDDAAEVVIDEPGATLTVEDDGSRAEGTLSIRAGCTGAYDMALTRR